MRDQLELGNTAITGEEKYCFNFTVSKKNLHYNVSNSFLNDNGTKMYRFKTKDSEMKPCPLFLGDVSKYFTVNSMKKLDQIDI